VRSNTFSDSLAFCPPRAPLFHVAQIFCNIVLLATWLAPEFRFVMISVESIQASGGKSKIRFVGPRDPDILANRVAAKGVHPGEIANIHCRQ
jgi:hypothetical protein